MDNSVLSHRRAGMRPIRFVAANVGGPRRRSIFIVDPNQQIAPPSQFNTSIPVSMSHRRF